MSKLFCLQRSIYADYNHEDMSTLRNRDVINIIIVKLLINGVCFLTLYRCDLMVEESKSKYYAIK